MPPASGASLEGFPIFWVDDIPFAPEECGVVCALVTTERRAFIELMRSRGNRFSSFIHPSCSVSRRARVGDGCIVNAGAIIGSNAILGDYTIVNRGALIGHDNRIGRCCTIGPGANIAGNVEIGNGALIAEGAVIRERLRIGDGAVVAAGAVVLRDVEANTMIAGIPARIIRSGVDGH